jgi:Holliday junction resolvasome RuvABC endonuclease subunit
VAKKKPKERLIKLPRRRFKRAKVKVLGLDCSSSTVGWGLMTIDKGGAFLVAHGHIKPLNNKHPLIQRLDDIYNRVGELCSNLDPSHIAIEDILLYMKGKSGAKTITTLAVFNRIIALSAHRHTKAKIKFYPAQTIRKLIKDSCRNVTSRIAKKDLPDIIRAELEPGFEDILNTKGNVTDETYDEGDGIATAWGGCLDLMEHGVLK